MDRSLCACVRGRACLRVVCPALRTVFCGLWCLQNLGGVDVKQTGELAMPLFFLSVLISQRCYIVLLIALRSSFCLVFTTNNPAVMLVLAIF